MVRDKKPLTRGCGNQIRGKAKVREKRHLVLATAPSRSLYTLRTFQADGRIMMICIKSSSSINALLTWSRNEGCNLSNKPKLFVIFGCYETRNPRKMRIPGRNADTRNDAGSFPQKRP